MMVVDLIGVEARMARLRAAVLVASSTVPSLARASSRGLVSRRRVAHDSPAAIQAAPMIAQMAKRVRWVGYGRQPSTGNLPFVALPATFREADFSRFSLECGKQTT
jgi:hypothetical protein